MFVLFSRLYPPTGPSLAFVWVILGFAGWGVGSVAKVALPIAYSPTNPSVLLWIASTSIPWATVGVGQALLLSAAVAGARARWTGGPSGRAVVGGLWVVACAVGGVLAETVPYLLVGAEGTARGSVTGIAESLEGWGVAENVAGVVIPAALVVPICYGIPTGLVLAGILSRVRRLRGGAAFRAGRRGG